jgi:hypothetical protein
MRTFNLARIAFLVVVAQALARVAEGTPYLPADIRVGATLTGAFSYPIEGSPADTSPLPFRGVYPITDPAATMSVTVADAEFSTILAGMQVVVTDLPADAEADFLQVLGTGDETTFAPFLSEFARQNPRLEPRGGIGLTFRFPATHFSSDAFPTSIDPGATIANPSVPPGAGIFGGVDGTSMQLPTVGIREWAFGFVVDPLDMSIATTSGMLHGNFLGTINYVDDRTVVGPPSAVPEPASLLLFGTALVALRKVAKRARRLPA